MKELVEEFEKHTIFTVPIKKEVPRTEKNGEENTKNISYGLQFIDSTRFMASLLSNLVNNTSSGIDKMKYIFGHYGKNVKLSQLN